MSEKDTDSHIVKEQKKIAKDTMEDDFKNFKMTDSTPAKIMIAVDKVSEGFDVKDIETIYLYSKVLSPVGIRQKVGRVLRNTGDKKKKEATVYWQNYDYFNHSSSKAATLKDVFYDKDIIEDDAEIQREIGRWRKGLQQPAGMYLEEIPKDIKAEREIIRRYEYLRILDMFGLDIALEGVGYYKIEKAGEEDRIYALQKEKKGYEQFRRVIRSDYFSLLIYKNCCNSFRDYAKTLNVTEEMLLADIKKTCFYMPNASLKDTKGNIVKKTFLVKDDDIKRFYEYIIEYNFEMPGYIDVTSPDDTSIKDNVDKNSNPDDTGNESIPQVADAFKEYLSEKEKKPSSTLLDGINVYREFAQYAKVKSFNKPKEYTDILYYTSIKFTVKLA